MLLLRPIIESKGLVWTTIEEKDRKFQIEYMNPTSLCNRNQGNTHIEITKHSYIPYKEQLYGFDKSNLEDQMMYGEVEILFNKN